MKVVYKLGEHAIKRMHVASISPPHPIRRISLKKDGKYLLCSPKNDEFSNHTGRCV